MKSTEQLQDELEEVKKRFRSLMDNCVDGLIIIDEDGSILDYNIAAEGIFQYAPDEVIGSNVSMLMPEPDRSKHDGYIGNYLRTGQAKVIGIGRQVAGRRKDGSTFPMDLSVGEMPDGGKRNFVGIVRDISERRQIENRLLQASKMEAVGELTGGVAHDFNNLLAILMMDLEMLEEMTAENAETAELVAEALDVTRTGAELTQRLLAFSRRQALSPTNLNINELVLSITGLLRRMIGADIRIDTTGPQNLWPVMIDQGQLENTLINLAINARDAMSGGGRLTISCENLTLDTDDQAEFPDLPSGDYVHLSVTDNGSGMSEETAMRAFEPFFTTKEAARGTGLGLSMVYGFVKQSGGNVSIYSAPGMGTTINMYFPRSANSQVSARPAIRDNNPPGGSEHILIVEDDHRLRERTAATLTALGYRVDKSVDGQDALGRIERGEKFDLLLTDIVMPGNLNGVELATRAKEIDPAARILLMTGYADISDILQQAIARGTRLIQKPFTRKNLAQQVRSALRK